MDEINSKEWWLWHINRRVAEFIHRPDARNERALLSLLHDYRRHCEHVEGEAFDEHEWAMNYR